MHTSTENTFRDNIYMTHFLRFIILLAALLPCGRAAVASAAPHDADTLVIRVDEHGAVGDGRHDDLPVLAAIVRGIERNTRPVKLVFRRGAEYYLAAHTDDCHGRILLRRVSGVVVEGNGARLTVHPSSRAFGVYRSRDVEIRNLTIDYSPLPYTQGRVTAIDTARWQLTFRVDRGFPLPRTGGKDVYSGGKFVDCIVANGRTRKFYQGHSWVTGVDSLSPRTYRVSYALNQQRQLRRGDFFCMKVAYAEPRLERNDTSSCAAERGEFVATNTGTVTALGCDGIVLRNLRFHASPMMTVVMKGCRRPVIAGCRIEGTGRRIVAGCSDGLHLKGCESQPQIIGCHFERTMDDAVHIKMSGDRVTAVASPRVCTIEHSDILWDNTNLGTGKRVMVFEKQTGRQLDTCVVMRYVPHDYRRGEVWLDHDVSGLREGMMLYLMPVGEALVAGCTFATQLQRAILTHQRTLVSCCRVEDNGIGLDLALMSDGIEGPPNQQVRVDRCVFSRIAWSVINDTCPSDGYWQNDSRGPGQPPAQLMVTHSEFQLDSGVRLLRAVRAHGVVLHGNTVYCRGALTPPSVLVETEHCGMVSDDTRVLAEP